MVQLSPFRRVGLPSRELLGVIGVRPLDTNFGKVVEWRYSGLQTRASRFDSGPCLQIKDLLDGREKHEQESG